MKTFSLTSAVVLSLIASGSALALEPSVPSATVKYADLDLRHTAGDATLYQRINQAALKVCAPLDPSTSGAPVMRTVHQACLAQAVSGAVSKINNPDFSAYVSSKVSPVTLKLASR